MLGDNIRLIRASIKMKPKVLADLVGITTNYLNMIEKNKRKNPEQGLLKKIADALGVKIDAFYEENFENIEAIKKEELPQELQDLGVEYVEVIREAKDSKLTPEEIRSILKVANSLKQK